MNRFKVLFLSATIAFSTQAGATPRGSEARGVIEFRQGDRVPLRLVMTGDLVELVDAPVPVVTIKRDFWLRVGREVVEFSLDGESFRPIQKSLTGSLTVSLNGQREAEITLDGRPKL